MTEGNLLGHIITKSDIIVDPERIKAISLIPPPTSKKAMQSFFGKINFVWKFISDFAQIVRPIHNMIKKNSNFKWNPPEKEAFDKIKQAITEAPSLQSPDFNKGFILYTFASNSSLTAVLTQKDTNNDERPISFMSTGLQGTELNYPEIDKQAYAVYKAVKHFRPYILKNHVTVFVPHPAVHALFIQQELGER